MSTGFPSDSAAARRIAAGLQIAEQARRAGRPSEAERVCRALLKEQPDAPAALNYLALLLRDRGELDAARDIDLGPYAGWSEGERVVANVHALYRDFGDGSPSDALTLMGEMAALAG